MLKHLQYFNFYQNKNLFNSIKSLHLDLGINYPGLQTKEDLHLNSVLKELTQKVESTVNGKVNKCWGNITKGKTKINWHTHKNCDLFGVYYLINKQNLGTLIKVNNEVYKTYSPENSLSIYKHNTLHSSPDSYIEEERCTIAFNIIL
jgi:hypothetical protein